MNKVKNNYEFWSNYLLNVVSQLEFLAKNRDEVYIDLHMHSNYSIDSKQSLSDLIERTNSLGLDIISITDHDSIEVYDELYEYLKSNKKTIPIIIPGIEFTIDNAKYGSQFHILQLMINPKEETLKHDVEYQKNAGWIRARKQIERLNCNKAMCYFFKKYNYNCTIEEFKDYLDKCFRPIPEYKTMMDYIRNKTYERGISNWDILNKMEEYNNEDKCLERKQIKINEYQFLKEKYRTYENSATDERFFHRLLATRGADDDFYSEYDAMGDLSVNKFQELKLNELNQKYLTVFAHPSDNKLYLLKELIKLNRNICGIELNRRCNYKNINDFYKTKEELNLIKIIGSDSHDIDSEFYDDISFYKYSKEELLLLIQAVKNYLTINFIDDKISDK